jgi:hypothetical protein
MLNLSKIFTVRNIAAFLLVMFCIGYIPMDSRAGVSMVKTAVALLCTFILLLYSPKISKPVILLFIYLFFVFLAAILHLESFRWSTLLYLCSFVMMYNTFYNLVVLEHAFSLDYYMKFLKGFLLAFVIVLLIQQIFIIAGVRNFPLINLTQFLDRGIGANSLSLEPSVSARMMTALFLSLLRMYEIKLGKPVSIRYLYTDAKWVLLGFLWSMLTMGSGTAFVALGILSLYFIKRQYAFTIVPILILFYISIPYINYKPLNRAVMTIEATLTMDADIVRKTDGSAAYRIAPMLNTINNLDLTKSEAWFGTGIDSGKKDMKNSMMGGITDYGFMAYIVGLIFVFSCCIWRFLSIETFLFFAGVGGGIANIAYLWGILLILTCTKYFKNYYKFNNYGNDE